MQIQWQARTFHEFAGGGKKDIIVYDVPCKSHSEGKIQDQIPNGKVLDFQMVKPGIVRVRVEF